MLCQLGQELDLFIEKRSHTVGDMLLMRAVDRHALLAVAVIPAGFLTWTVIFVLVFLSEIYVSPLYKFIYPAAGRHVPSTGTLSVSYQKKLP